MCEKYGNDSYSASLDGERKRTASGGAGDVGGESIVSHETQFRGDTISSTCLVTFYSALKRQDKRIRIFTQTINWVFTFQPRASLNVAMYSLCFH